MILSVRSRTWERPRKRAWKSPQSTAEAPAMKLWCDGSEDSSGEDEPNGVPSVEHGSESGEVSPRHPLAEISSSGSGPSGRTGPSRRS